MVRLDFEYVETFVFRVWNLSPCMHIILMLDWLISCKLNLLNFGSCFEHFIFLVFFVKLQFFTQVKM